MSKGRDEFVENNNMLVNMFEMMAKMTGKTKYVTTANGQRLDEKITGLTMRIDSKLTDNQYEQLNEIITQFHNILDDFISENNIEME